MEEINQIIGINLVGQQTLAVDLVAVEEVFIQ